MKLFIFTDLHSDMQAFKQILKDAKKTDLIISAGDHTIFSKDNDKIAKKLNALKKPVLMLQGNHETADEVKQICKKYENLTFLHKKYVIINNILFLGYGGGGFSKRYKYFDDVIGPKFSKIIKEKKPDKVVLVTHAPPYNTDLDFVMGNHVGSKSFSDFIKKNKVDLYICGHIHECEQIQQKKYNTLIINPGLGAVIDLES